MNPGWTSLREIDEQLGLPKGSAFRAFRSLEPHWQSGRDFELLHHELDRDAIQTLRQQQRIYASTVNLVLLAPHAAEALRVALAGQMRRSTTHPAE